MDREKLKLDDVFVKTVNRAGSLMKMPDYHKCIVVKVSDGEQFVSHSDGTPFVIHPKAFSSVPQSVAYELFDRDDIYVLSKEEAEVFIQKAMTNCLEVNKDIIKYNEEVRVYNETRKNDDGYRPKHLKRMMKGPQNGVYSPYEFFIRSLEKPVEPEAPPPKTADEPEPVMIKPKRKSSKKE